MKNHRILTVLLILLSSGLSRAGDATRKIILVEEAKRVSERDIHDASQSESEKNIDGGYNANVKVIDCFASMEYRYTGGRYVDEPIKFRMHFPEEMKSGRKYPLVIWLHGAAESGKDNTRQLSHIQSTIEYLTGRNKLDFFMIVTQCPGDNTNWGTSVSSEGKGDAPMTIAEEIMETVIREYPVDENRLSVFGLCSGGSAAWDFVAKRPGRFAAMAVCSSAPGTHSVDAFKNTAVWSFNNRDDMPCEPVERFVRAINASGGNAFATIREKGGHDTWTNAMLNQKVIGWMILHDLQKGGPPAGEICHHRTIKHLFLLFGLPLVAILCVIPFYRRQTRSSRYTIAKPP